MVEQTLNEIVTWIGELLNTLVSSVLGNITFSPALVKTVYLPGFAHFDRFITILAWLALFGCLIVAAIQMISVPITGQERPNVVQILVRAFVAGGLIVSIDSLTDEFLKIVNKLYGFIGISHFPNMTIEGLISPRTAAAQGTDLDGLVNTAGIIATGIVFVFLGIIILVVVIKAVIAVLTRAILLIVSVYAGPFCVAFFVTPSTSIISSMWFKTVIGQSVLLLLSAWCLRVAVTSLMDNSNALLAADAMTKTNSPNAADPDSGANLYIVFLLGKWMYVWFLCKVVCKLEDFVKSIGFNPYPTGGSVRAGIGSIVGVAMMASRVVSGATKGAAAAKGGSNASGKTGMSSKPASGENMQRIPTQPGSGSVGGGNKGPGGGKNGPGGNTPSGKPVGGNTSTRGFETTGTPKKTIRETQKAMSQGAPIRTPEGARWAVNEAWRDGKSVKGSVLNRAFELDGADSKSRYLPDHDYKMEKGNFVHGPMEIRNGKTGQWNTKDMVTDFNADSGKAISGKEFIGKNGAIMTADTSSYIDNSSNGSIRSYGLKSTGETVQSREAKEIIRSSQVPEGSYEAKTFNTAFSVPTGSGIQPPEIQAVPDSHLRPQSKEVNAVVDGKAGKKKEYAGYDYGNFQRTDKFSGEVKKFDGVYFPNGYRNTTVNQDGKHMQDSDSRKYYVGSGSDRHSAHISKLYTMPDGKGQIGELKADYVKKPKDKKGGKP